MIQACQLDQNFSRLCQLDQNFSRLLSVSQATAGVNVKNLWAVISIPPCLCFVIPKDKNY